MTEFGTQQPQRKRRGYWQSTENVRQFFKEFVGQMGFDASNPENWKTITRMQVEAKNVSIL